MTYFKGAKREVEVYSSLIFETYFCEFWKLFCYTKRTHCKLEAYKFNERCKMLVYESKAKLK